MRFRRALPFFGLTLILTASADSPPAETAQQTDAAPQQFLVGDYEAQGQRIQVRLRPDGVLTFAVPPQPVRELEPLGGVRFAQKGLPGYIVEFVRDPSGNVVALISHQPNGDFAAARVRGAQSATAGSAPAAPRPPTAAPTVPPTASKPVTSPADARGPVPTQRGTPLPGQSQTSVAQNDTRRGRPPLSQRRPLAFDQFVFPTLVTAAYDGDFEALPDYQSVRDYFVSIEQVFNRSCYAAFFGTAEATQSYWSTEQRTLLRDWSRTVNNPDLALETANETFKRWASDGFKADHSIANEGVRDGRLLVQLHTCESVEVIQFRRNLHRLFVLRRDVRAAPNNSGRIAALVNPRLRQQLGVAAPTEIVSTPIEMLTDACVESWRRTVLPRRIEKPDYVMREGTDWCRCLAPRLLDAGLSSADMAALRADFVMEQARIREASTNQSLKNACFKR